MSLSRRRFLGASAGTLAASCFAPSVSVSLAQSVLRAQSVGEPVIRNSERLSDGWEYFQGPLANTWQVWHSEEIGVWHPVTMPHSFNAYDCCDPDTSYYRGPGWYRTYLKPQPALSGWRTLLHFEGAGQITTVHIGNQQIGRHVGGYDEFVYDITDALAQPNLAVKDKGIPFAVLCDNSRTADTIPSDLSDFSLYGGLYRHVNIVRVPDVSVEAAHIVATNVSSNSADISVRVRLYNPAAAKDPVAAKTPVTLLIDIQDPSGKIIHSAQRTQPAWKGEVELTHFTVTSPALWSTANPQLYSCHVQLNAEASQRVDEQFGIRFFEFVDHGPFKLNGERLLIRGTHRHEDHAGYASAQPDDLVRKELQLIRDMGANFIRLAHYQQSRLVLELCDQLGLLVWEEIPWCRSGVTGETMKEMAREKLRRMIDQHTNHPSVILWGLGNEDDWPTEYPSVNQPEIRALMTELRELAHQLDPTRLTSFRRCEFARDIPDVYSPSIWAGWYSGTYPEYQKSLETNRNNVKHMLHIEWGADSHAGRHSEDPDKSLKLIQTGQGTEERGLAYLPVGGPARASKDGDWSESYACNLFDWHLKVQESLPWLTGAAQWVFKDFTTPLRPENPIPRINQKGLVQRDLTLKESYYLFQSYWTDTPMAHIYGHTWPIRWGTPAEKKMVKVYSNCETAELFLNGISLGNKTRNSQDFPAAGLRWETPFKPGKNLLRVVAKKAGHTVTDEITFAYQTAKWNKPTQLKLTEVALEANVVTVEARLYDAANVQCLDARNRISFSVAGNGSLLDNLGTVQGSRVVELANGCARIRCKLNGGAAHLAVTAEGVAPAFVSVHS